MANILEKQFEVCSYDVDIFRKLKISSLFGFFQEIASQHAENLGVGFFDLAKKNAFWALSRVHLKIEQYPVWKDEITYKTWPKGYNRLFGFREFEIFNQDKLVGSGSSDWIIMDLNTEQIVNPETIIVGIEPFNECNILNVKTKRVKPNQNYLNSVYRMVRYNDLDMNNHVNSIKYLEWVFDCLPIELLTSHELEELSINYLHEIPANMEVEILFSEVKPLNYQFRGKVKNASTSSFLIELSFRRN